MSKPKEYTIEKGIPVPSGNAARGRRKHPMVPLDKMDVGDSVYIPGPLSKTALSNRLTNERKRLLTPEENKTFRMRSVVERSGWRVWRVR